MNFQTFQIPGQTNRLENPISTDIGIYSSAAIKALYKIDEEKYENNRDEKISLFFDIPDENKEEIIEKFNYSYEFLNIDLLFIGRELGFIKCKNFNEFKETFTSGINHNNIYSLFFKIDINDAKILFIDIFKKNKDLFNEFLKFEWLDILYLKDVGFGNLYNNHNIKNISDLKNIIDEKNKKIPKDEKGNRNILEDSLYFTLEFQQTHSEEYYSEKKYSSLNTEEIKIKILSLYKIKNVDDFYKIEEEKRKKILYFFGFLLDNKNMMYIFDLFDINSKEAFEELLIDETISILYNFVNKVDIEDLKKYITKKGQVKELLNIFLEQLRKIIFEKILSFQKKNKNNRDGLKYIDKNKCLQLDKILNKYLNIYYKIQGIDIQEVKVKIDNTDRKLNFTQYTKVRLELKEKREKQIDEQINMFLNLNTENLKIISDNSSVSEIDVPYYFQELFDNFNKNIESYDKLINYIKNFTIELEEY